MQEVLLECSEFHDMKLQLAIVNKKIMYFITHWNRKIDQFNVLSSAEKYLRREIGSSLVWVFAWQQFGATLQPRQLLTHCQLTLKIKVTDIWEICIKKYHYKILFATYRSVWLWPRITGCILTILCEVPTHQCLSINDDLAVMLYSLVIAIVATPQTALEPKIQNSSLHELDQIHK